MVTGLEDITVKQIKSGIKIQEYLLISQIAAGGTSIIWQAAKNNKIYAFKVIEKSYFLGNEDKLYKEIELLSTLKHQNIIQFIEYFENNQLLFIVMEFISGHLLQDYLLNLFQDEQKDPSLYCIIKEIFQGYHYVHLKNIIHRDIKFQNIMITDDKKIKIIDFGFSNKNTHMQKSTVGTVGYMSPEMLLGLEHSYSTDIWSLGVLLYQILNKEKPFQLSSISGELDKDKLKEIYEKIVNQDFKQNTSLKPEVNELLQRMLEFDQEKRITFDQIFSLDIFKGKDYDFYQKPVKKAALNIADDQIFIQSLMKSSFGKTIEQNRIIKKKSICQSQNLDLNKSLFSLQDGFLSKTVLQHVQEIKKSQDDKEYKLANSGIKLTNSVKMIMTTNHQDLRKGFSLIGIEEENEKSERTQTQITDRDNKINKIPMTSPPQTFRNLDNTNKQKFLKQNKNVYVEKINYYQILKKLIGLFQQRVTDLHINNQEYYEFIIVLQQYLYNILLNIINKCFQVDPILVDSMLEDKALQKQIFGYMKGNYFKMQFKDSKIWFQIKNLEYQNKDEEIEAKQFVNWLLLKMINKHNQKQYIANPMDLLYEEVMYYLIIIYKMNSRKERQSYLEEIEDFIQNTEKGQINEINQVMIQEIIEIDEI